MLVGTRVTILTECEIINGVVVGPSECCEPVVTECCAELIQPTRTSAPCAEACCDVPVTVSPVHGVMDACCSEVEACDCAPCSNVSEVNGCVESSEVAECCEPVELLVLEIKVTCRKPRKLSL